MKSKPKGLLQQMDDANVNVDVPDGFQRLNDSKRSFSPKAKLIGPVDGNDTFSITIILRRRADGPPTPGLEYFSNTRPRKRNRLSAPEFTARYGAHPDDVQAVVEFSKEHHLTVTSKHLGRRSVILSGTAAQFSRAFAISLVNFEVADATRRQPFTVTRRYRDYDGFIHIPESLIGAVIGVFGLDSAPIGARASYPGDPPITGTVTVDQVAKLYNFPTPGAAIGGQTIGIIAPAGALDGGFLQSDLDAAFANIGLTAPAIISVFVEPGVKNVTSIIATTAAAAAGDQYLSFASTASINSSMSATYSFDGATYLINLSPTSATTAKVITCSALGEPVYNGVTTPVPFGTAVIINIDKETTQDIAIACLAARGANVVVYFTDNTQQGWVDLMGRALHPDDGDLPVGVKPPSVLSASWIIAPGDDPNGLSYSDLNFSSGVTTGTLIAMSAAFEDAAILQDGPTICIASGDLGSSCGVGDGYAHTNYPASDPWILACGGTTLGKFPHGPGLNSQSVEYAWNDPDADPSGNAWGTSGGGVSAYFPVPAYQNETGIPETVNTNLEGIGIKSFPVTGRGVPDVAANASLMSGYSGIPMGGFTGHPGNGTSASAPLWAGLIAILNSNAGFNLGFANPLFYSFPSTDFCPITPLWRDPNNPALADCPEDNGSGGVPGYRTHESWDPVTGLGSPNGMKLLISIKKLDHVYILGGYQSPDIILTDLTTNQQIPIGAQPLHGWGTTMLEPLTSYGYSANIHNDFSFAVENVVVSFWAIPGGLGRVGGKMVGAPQTVSIPGHTTINVRASAPFTTGLRGSKLSAAVSIYSVGNCEINPVAAVEIPDPGLSGTHQCSAFRATDSIIASVGTTFRLEFGFNCATISVHRPILIEWIGLRVPQTSLIGPILNERADVARMLGATPNMPTYLMPGFERDFELCNLKAKLIPVHGVRLAETSARYLELYPEAGAETVAFDIFGEIPADARSGDVILLKITAIHPVGEEEVVRQVDFLQFIYVKDEPRG